MRKPKHSGPHKYQRMTIGQGDYTVMKCMLPDCSHFIQLALAIGRASLCWSCNTEILLNSETIHKKKPICDDCKETRKARLESMEEIA